MSLTTRLSPALQQPPWPDPEAVDAVEESLRRRPPLVGTDEVAALRDRLAVVARGEASLLHAGDCAEPFADTSPEVVRRKSNHLRELSEALRAATGAAQSVGVGRMAGQYAKPRSRDGEPGPDGSELPSYRGDAVNAAVADRALRTPDPRRMLLAYDNAAAVLRTLRDIEGGASAGRPVFVSHELLLLPLERALLRRTPRGTILTSAHFLWIGERTRHEAGRHVDLARSACNPVGVKLGPTVTPEQAARLALLLNPDRVPGRLVLIVRMGADVVARALPPVMRAVGATGVPVVWLCDPMHANTYQVRSGVKTRSVPEIIREVRAFVRTALACGARPGGLSLETTPEPVTECVDEERGSASDARLPHFRSLCDPRLNPAQALRVVHSFTH